MNGVGWWSAGSDWDYRIINLPGLLKAYAPVLQKRAEGLRDFETSIGIREHDRTDIASLTLANGTIAVEPGRRGKSHVELDPVSAVRLIFGGPPAGRTGEIPAPLERIFPVPIHVPALDHV